MLQWWSRKTLLVVFNQNKGRIKCDSGCLVAIRLLVGNIICWL
uniref:Uncharacterized protein n=1 Tax=Rhizophora mucronata TaxID=61149 RepID=A0A2P2QAS1_RHIMU